jgi:hypothetical protein
MIKLRRIISVDVTCIMDIGSVYKILVGKLQRNKERKKETTLRNQV